MLLILNSNELASNLGRFAANRKLLLPYSATMRPKPTMAALQESEYGEHRDYTYGSPHLRHASIRRPIEDDLNQLVREIRATHGHCRVLEVGAGHGSFTSFLVDAGAHVTVTEMSEPSARMLKERFATHPQVEVVFDPDGSECQRIAQRGCDLIVFISVLHHIPDYLTTVRSLVERQPPGAALYCAQDPMWYPRRSRINLAITRLCYFTWRIRQGNILRGMKTRLRRARGILDESQPADMVEYHVVRDGVDENALREMLSEFFEIVTVNTYWSTQSALLQRLGESLSLTSEFGIRASQRKPTAG